MADDTKKEPQQQNPMQGIGTFEELFSVAPPQQNPQPQGLKPTAEEAASALEAAVKQIEKLQNNVGKGNPFGFAQQPQNPQQGGVDVKDQSVWIEPKDLQFQQDPQQPQQQDPTPSIDANTIRLRDLGIDLGDSPLMGPNRFEVEAMRNERIRELGAGLASVVANQTKPAQSVKNNDETWDVTGPINFSAFKAQLESSLNVDKEMRAAKLQELLGEVGMISTKPDAQVFVIGKQGQEGTYKIASGEYEDRTQPRKVVDRDLTIEGTSDKQIRIDNGYDLEGKVQLRSINNAVISWPVDGSNPTLKGGIVIPLSDNGEMLQQGVEKLVKEVDQASSLDRLEKAVQNVNRLLATLPANEKAGERPVKQQTLDFTASNKLGEATLTGYNGSDFHYDSKLNVSHPEELNKKYDEFQRHYREGDFDRALIITDSDAEGHRTSRILIGKSDGDKISFTESYNFQKGERSDLKPPPITLRVVDGKVRQADLEGALNLVREAVEKGEIVQLAPKGTNPVFDALLEQAPNVELTLSSAGMPRVRGAKETGVA